MIVHKYIAFKSDLRAVSFHPVPLAMARVVFLSRKKIDERFQSNATFLFSKVSERPEKLINLCLPQQVKRG